MSLTIEEAAETAKDFAHQNGYPYTRLESVDLVDSQWTVVLDPGLIFTQLMLEITIDDDSGRTVGFRKKAGTALPA